MLQLDTGDFNASEAFSGIYYFEFCWAYACLPEALQVNMHTKSGLLCVPASFFPHGSSLLAMQELLGVCAAICTGKRNVISG
eukprot:730018-Pelagomonas_calceolata.AAC.1